MPFRRAEFAVGSALPNEDCPDQEPCAIQIPTPPAPEPVLTDWRPAPDFDPLSFEKVVGLDTLFNIAWLNRGLELATPVARVVTPIQAGTGFLIAADLVMTNHHVIPDADTARVSTLEFNFQRSWSGQMEPVRRFRLDETRMRTSEELDYAIVGVHDDPGTVVGFVDLAARADPSVNDFVTIIQHPRGGPKQISLTDNKVASVFGNLVQYATDTDTGSSGAPVFNQNWEIVALHHAGGDLAGPDGKKHFINEGVILNAVVRDAAQFLGVTDLLFDACSSEMSSVLAKLIEQADAIGDLNARAEEILRSNASFAFALDDWIKLNRRPDEAAPAAAAAAGVAIGAATIMSARPTGHGSIKAVPTPKPAPSDALVAAMTESAEGQQTPSQLYAAALTRLREAPDLVGEAANSGDPDKGLRGATAAFLTGVLMGAKACEACRAR